MMARTHDGAEAVITELNTEHEGYTGTMSDLSKW
jgi:hypothetical protein